MNTFPFVLLLAGLVMINRDFSVGVPATGRCSPRSAALPDYISSPLLATLPGAPPVNHRSSNQLRSLPGASNDSFRAFDARRVDGYSPFVSLDPSADRVPDPPVLHRKPLRATKDEAACVSPFAFAWTYQDAEQRPLVLAFRGHVALDGTRFLIRRRRRHIQTMFGVTH